MQGRQHPLILHHLMSNAGGDKHETSHVFHLAPGRDLLVAAVVLLAFIPFLVLHIQRLWAQTHYQYFPFVIAAAAGLLYYRWPHHETYGPRKLMSAGLLCLSFLVLLSGTLLFSPWLATIGFVLALGAAIACFAGSYSRHLVSSWALLWLIIPLPLQLDSILIGSLQHVTSRAASLLLDLLQVNHLLAGNSLETPTRQYMVEEACSGMQSLLGLFAVTAIYAAWRQRALFPSILLLISSVMWAGLFNVVRITVVVAADVQLGIDLTQGLAHDAFGVVIFGCACVMLLSTDQLIDFLTHPIELFEPNPLIVMWNRIFSFPDHMPAETIADGSVNQTGISAGRGIFSSWFVAIAFLAVGVLQTMQAFAQGELFNPHQEVALTLTQESLPSPSGNWQVQNFETIERSRGNTMGRYSRTWTYRKDQQLALFSVDFPYIGWKELCECYLVTGWELRSRRIVDDVQPPYVEVEVSNPAGESLLLFYSSADVQGRPLTPSASVTLFQHQLGTKIRTGLSSFGMDYSSFQAQLMVPTTDLSQEQREELKQLFVRLRASVYDRVAKGAVR